MLNQLRLRGWFVAPNRVTTRVQCLSWVNLVIWYIIALHCFMRMRNIQFQLQLGCLIFLRLLKVFLIKRLWVGKWVDTWQLLLPTYTTIQKIVRQIRLFHANSSKIMKKCYMQVFFEILAFLNTLPGFLMSDTTFWSVSKWFFMKWVLWTFIVWKKP